VVLFPKELGRVSQSLARLSLDVGISLIMVLVGSRREGKARGYDYLVAVFILCSEVHTRRVLHRIVGATDNPEIHFRIPSLTMANSTKQN
jgi:hypothetical protein